MSAKYGLCGPKDSKTVHYFKLIWGGLSFRYHTAINTKLADFCCSLFEEQLVHILKSICFQKYQKIYYSRFKNPTPLPLTLKGKLQMIRHTSEGKNSGGLFI